MKNLQTFNEFLNEERVYGMFNDAQGKPSKLSQEILDICMKGLPCKPARYTSISKKSRSPSIFCRFALT